MILILLAFLVSFLVSVGITPGVIYLARRFNWVDDKRYRSHPAQTHTGIIPRAGGLAIYSAILICVLIFIDINKLMLGVLLGGLLTLGMGILDDIYDLSPYLRIFMIFMIAGIVILFGLGVPYITNPLGGIIRLDTLSFTIHFFGDHKFLILANIFSALIIASLMNFVNWSSGVDGQLSGFVGVSCMVLGIFALRFTAYDVSSLSVAQLGFIVAGAFFGFLVWNFYPQKIMPGFSGGALAGYFLAILAILSYTKIGVLIMVLSVPLVDAMYTMIRRVVRGKSPFRGDAGHFHHRLLEIGWGRRRITVFYAILSALFGIGALYFNGYEKLLALGVTVVLLAFFILVINMIKENENSI